MLIAEEDSSLRLENSPIITGEYVYVLKPQKEDNSGITLTRIPLEMEGPHGVKATFSDYAINSLVSGVIRETNVDAEFCRLRTIFIDGKEYIPTQVPDSKIVNGKLDFYLTPVEGLVIEIKRPTGQLTLDHPDGILRGELVSRDSYESRNLEARAKVPARILVREGSVYKDGHATIVRPSIYEDEIESIRNYQNETEKSSLGKKD
jgi:hypothetical protein